MPKSKKNPRRIPRSQLDYDKLLKKYEELLKTIEEVKREATDLGTKRAVYIMLYVLADKLGYEDEEDATRAWMAFNRAIEEILEGRITWQEIADVIKEEYGYEIELKE